MTRKRIFILNGHPAKASLTGAVAQSYATAAKTAGHEVRLTNLHDLEFDPDYGFGGYVNQKPLEADLETLLQDIEWAEHVVVATPMWWGGLPAKLKGVFDRAFLPGRTFDTRNTTKLGLPAPLLTGRTGRVLLLSDTPGWFFRLFYRNALIVQIQQQILEFVGIKPVKVTQFTGASHPKAGVADKWIKRAAKIGAKAA
ncbi:NAD(P)H-dependent oxidoreductase [Shimia sp. R9_1]|uniref:NAD(P)H-dependent oxidoreductase n=1 Tax=unclassified Shimia TaxID=2630038 RepID=UPI001AD9C4DA|nr:MULTISPECIES: NAD(P)H-dependent oxidoreductase [unclassified Shimia]MBO9399714.1 NAD(P)H-dependent oxidoreductase [Shimia sp. R9_3]MBO9407611.1 NAD(P)H-dependent oxidoreductase [Shimia sp. R9_1]